MIDWNAVIIPVLIGAPIGCAIGYIYIRWWFYREFKGGD